MFQVDNVFRPVSGINSVAKTVEEHLKDGGLDGIYGAIAALKGAPEPKLELQKIIDKLQSTELTEEDLHSLEHWIIWTECGGNAWIELLRGLASKYESLHLSGDLQRVRGTIEWHQKTVENITKGVWLVGLTLNLLIPTLCASEVMGLNESLAATAGLGSALLFTAGKAYNQFNLFGLYSGILASAKGFNPLPAAAIGLGTAVAARNPYVQKAARIIAWDLPEAIVEGSIKTAEIFLDTAQIAASKCLEFAKKIVNAADSALDTISFSK